MTENIRTGNIRVVDVAEIPKFPVSPKKTQNMLMGLIVGLALGIGLAFFLEYLDNTIKTPDDIKGRLKIPYLGPVPILAMAETDNPGGKPGNPGRREPKPEDDLIIISSPKSTASESYRGLRTSILVVLAGETHREITKNGIGLLQSANAGILGAILNGVDMGCDSYYYYQYYYYYYGEDGEKKKKIHREKRAQSRYYGSDREGLEGVKPDTAA